MSTELYIEQLITENEKLKSELKMVRLQLSESLIEINEKNKNIHAEHKELSDSVNYAKKIQQAILTPLYTVKQILPNSFILYKPKDVVSGDFYFIRENEENVTFAAVDCTGHGVPGAMLSVIGFNFLNHIVREKKVIQPSVILSYLDEHVNDMLRQTDNESGIKDGMDIAICTLNKENGKLQFAGAFNPLYYVSKGVLTETKGDKLPIGMNEDGVVDVYSNHVIQLKKGDCIYLLSDGFADQFGGVKDKKYKYRKLKEFLVSNSHKSMFDQKALLEIEFEHWRGQNEQVDDVLIMGVKY